MKTQHKKVPKCIRSDRGREYVNSDLINYLKSQGTKIQYTAPYSPQQNGVAERKNRYLIEMARCMLLDAKLKRKFWAEAVNTANFLQNRLPTRTREKTPYEIWNSRKPDVSYFHIFGCEVYAHIPDELRRKLDVKAEKYIFLRYSEQSKAYKLLNKKTEKIKISRDVVFLDKYDNTSEEIDNSMVEIDFSQEDVKQSTTESSSSDESAQKQLQVEPECRRSTRKNRGVPPGRYLDATSLAAEIEDDPRTRKEALDRPDKEEWIKAMDEELSSLKHNNTWTIVETPKGAYIVSCKWVYKTKRNSRGEVERYKARLVARGFSQKFGTDYDEVFAPVVRQTTLKVLLTVAGKKNLIIKHFDAKSAFLNGDLQEEIYMQQPRGYAVAGKEKYVCRLERGIYGLKQAANIWYEKLRNVLKYYDFSQSREDQCLFTKKMKDDTLY